MYISCKVKYYITKQDRRLSGEIIKVLKDRDLIELAKHVPKSIIEKSLRYVFQANVKVDIYQNGFLHFKITGIDKFTFQAGLMYMESGDPQNWYILQDEKISFSLFDIEID